MGSSVQRFPVPFKNLSLDIKGNKTDIVICSYDDHIFVIATQIGTMGTILHARKIINASPRLYLFWFNGVGRGLITDTWRVAKEGGRGVDSSHFQCICNIWQTR
ncbi:uncharacterized protein LOC110641894 isoform X2 [Hevea brasiliensis]|uniref:uncharacterized protein LOC110641894 isoform X2 n=1 Tax=Hevea brasiliensis TaxID=3981 RepID=UPI0025F3CC84|nr:uncharacterized protein LOC110641894 isoform X2 [Hevea brasiliensis]